MIIIPTPKRKAGGSHLGPARQGYRVLDQLEKHSKILYQKKEERQRNRGRGEKE